jgi:hypothetical protein
MPVPHSRSPPSRGQVAARIAGACLVVLGLGAGVALFALGNALIQSAGDPVALWYVLGLGLLLGATGFAVGRAAAEPIKV